MTELEAEIKAEVLEARRSVKGTYHTFVWSKPRVSMDERKVRLILGKLVTEYGVPVCAHSGKAGRWLARAYADAAVTQAEHYARAAAEKRRGDAYNSCHYPPDETGEIKPVQPALLDVPEPDIIPYWRW